jgi:hypothetical protein
MSNVDTWTVEVAFYPATRRRSAWYVELTAPGDTGAWTPDAVDAAEYTLRARPVIGLVLLHYFERNIPVPSDSELLWAVEEVGGDVVPARDLVRGFPDTSYIGIYDGDDEPDQDDIARHVEYAQSDVRCSLERAQRRAAATGERA